MTTFDVDDRQLTKFVGKMARFVPAFKAAEQEMVAEQAQVLLQTIVRHASGRPGPNVVSGSYVSRFYVERTADGWMVCNPSPQARRLEYGFIGVDSRGRHYAQPPFPHIRPAAAEFEPGFIRAYASLPGRVFRGL